MVSVGFVKASSNNLPSVNMFMVSDYIKNDERFNAPELRGVKATAATREQYGDNAIGYVEVHREGSICTMQCKVCPEHRVRLKNYSVVLIVNEEEEKIIEISCRDCAASLGGCKHALAFLMWSHRRTEEASPTDVTCYWTRPRLAAVGSSVKFIKATDFSSAKCKTVPLSAPSSSFTASLPSFREEVLKVAKSSELTGQICRYSSIHYEEKYDHLSIHKLMWLFRSDGGVECGDFFSFCESKMAPQLCKEGEKASRKQANSPAWRELRYGRITASKLFEFVRCETPDGTLVDSIIGAYKVQDNRHMKRGRLLEKEVIKCVEKSRNIKCSDCGIFVLPVSPIFGASPDGLSDQYVIEVKCPSSDKTIKNYIKDGDISEKCKAQINLQMFCAKRKKGLFCVASPDFETTKKVNILHVNFDEVFLDNLLVLAKLKWEKFVFPKLYNSV